MNIRMQRQRISRSRQAGMTLIELLIAMTILAIGMGGILIMITAAMSANSSTRNDSTATMLGQMVLEQITANPQGWQVTPTPVPTVFDCQGTGWPINTTPGAPGAGAAGAALLGGRTPG